MDHSFLDTKYFVDESIYNCPFCKRRHVRYSVVENKSFDWTEQKRCFVFLVKCHSCKKTSMHLSFSEVPVTSYRHSYEAECLAAKFFVSSESDIPDLEIGHLDRMFFFSVPTSFFVLDSRIPRVLRDLISEAEGCLKSNFLTGASACARKAVYELARLQAASGNSYDERIKSLKVKLPLVDPTFFDTLLTIQQITSTKVHEESFDGWENRHLRVILSALTEALNEIYVAPAIKDERRKTIVALRDELSPLEDMEDNNA